MGRIDAEEMYRQSLVQGDKEEQIRELKELIRLLEFAAEEVSDSQKEIRKSLDKLHNFIKQE